MSIFDWVRKTFKTPQVALKFWVAVVGLLAYLLLAFGIEISEAALENITTLLFLLTAGGVWAIPNQRE